MGVINWDEGRKPRGGTLPVLERTADWIRKVDTSPQSISAIPAFIILYPQFIVNSYNTNKILFLAPFPYQFLPLFSQITLPGSPLGARSSSRVFTKALSIARVTHPLPTKHPRFHHATGCNNADNSSIDWAFPRVLAARSLNLESTSPGPTSERPVPPFPVTSTPTQSLFLYRNPRVRQSSPGELCPWTEKIH